MTALATINLVAAQAIDTLTRSEFDVSENIAFAVIAGLMLFSSLKMVTTGNVVHAALYLMIVLAASAAIFILLGSDFVGATQILVYIGAIVVLFLFGIMLTKAQIGSEEGLNNKGWQLGIPVALTMFGLMSYVILDTYRDDTLPARTTQGGFKTERISDELLQSYFVPFIAISFVLLAAAIGAIVLARKD